MTYPFPGMDPYLEHPVLWEGFHARLIPALANQLQPLLDPRYIATIEERVFVEGPQQRIPDVWVQKVQNGGTGPTLSTLEVDAGVLVEIEEQEVHQKRVEIVDAYNGLKLVAIIELVSPTNKRSGPGRVSYLEKQQEILGKDCHLIEIDLHRTGEHVVNIPQWRAEEFEPYDYLACISRWPWRNQYRLFPTALRQRLPRLPIPLAEPDPDVRLDLQAAVEQVYQDGRYAKRIRYHDPCDPPLSPGDQSWAREHLNSILATGNGK